MHHSRRGRVRAPELTGRGAWIYTRHELSLVALEGKVVLLNFWAFWCIDCLHFSRNSGPSRSASTSLS